MKNLKNRHIIWTLVSIIMFLLGFYLVGAIILTIVIFDYLKGDKKKEEKPEIKQQVLEVSDNSKVEEFRLVCEMAREQLNESQKVKMATDVRQFIGRSDVTKEEVYQYMMNKDNYVGFIVQQLHLDRIQEVCNFSEEDRKWVTHELWGKTKIFPDKEGQAFSDWIINDGKKETKKLMNSIDNMWNELVKDDICSIEEAEKCRKKDWEDTEDIRQVYLYDEWLKEKGYI